MDHDTDTTLHGIANCDTVRKARRWLDDNDVAYRFHDFRKDGVDEATLQGWIATLDDWGGGGGGGGASSSTAAARPGASSPRRRGRTSTRRRPSR